MYRLGLLLILLLSNTCFAELDWDIALEDFIDPRQIKNETFIAILERRWNFLVCKKGRPLSSCHLAVDGIARFWLHLQ